MSKKTLIRFSENLLQEMPYMANDAFRVAKGDVCAWIHTGERVITALGQTISMCLIHHTLKNVKIDVAKELECIQEEYDEAEIKALEQYRKKLLDIKENLKKERISFESRIEKEKKNTEKIQSRKILTDDIKEQINNDTNEKIQMMQENASEKAKLTAAKSNLVKKQTELQILEKKAYYDTIKEVRRHLKEAIDIYESKLKGNPLTNKLSYDDQLRMDEQYRILLWQYQKHISI